MATKVLTTILTLLMTVQLLFTNAVTLVPKNVAANETTADYLENGDIIVISPGEKWFGDTRGITPTVEWELSAQSSGDSCGDDIHFWKYGTDTKFRISNMDGKNTFKIQAINFQETKGNLYWDVKNGSVKPKEIIHVWDLKNSKDASQRFFLVDDKDGDPETFYIKNKNSDLYLVPEGYFDNPDANISKGEKPKKGENWDKTGVFSPDGGRNVVQSRFSFRWRIQVLNREAAGVYPYVDWMSSLKGDTYLSQLSIPGTHDTGTANVWGGGNSDLTSVATQKYFVDEQLIAGIRAFDLRVNENEDSNTFVLLHGFSYYVCHLPNRDGYNGENMRLSDVLYTMIKFLKEHPRETLVVTLKIDAGHDTGVQRRLAKMLLREYFTDASRKDFFYQWGSSSQSEMVSPQLQDVRGQIVLLSRVDFSDDVLVTDKKDVKEFALSKSDASLLRSYTGPDISEWDNKYDDNKHYAQIVSPYGAGVKVWVQDDWQCDDENKEEQFYNTIDQLNGELQKQSKYSEIVMPDVKDFVFNYTSKTTGDWGATPLNAAENMNNEIFHKSRFSNSGRVGIVMMDYASKALASRVIQHNEKYNFRVFSGLDFAFAESSSNIKQMSFTGEWSELVESSPGIVWPTGATVTYGYMLGEASLHFADPEAENPVSGYYYFENKDDILTVKDDNGKPQTLMFKSYDGTVTDSAQIPVTINPRWLPVSVGNYQIEYGDKFDITNVPFPSAGGYFLYSDMDNLDKVIAAAGIHYGVLDNDGNGVTPTSKTKPCSGIIRLTAERPQEVKHPNYDTSVENGVWCIQPRTVSVKWSYGANGWKAKIGNIINGDKVTAVVNAQTDGIGATLTLDGLDAYAYRIAEGDEISPAKTDISDNSNKTLYTVLLIAGIILVLGACGFFLIKKAKAKK